MHRYVLPLIVLSISVTSCMDYNQWLDNPNVICFDEIKIHGSPLDIPKIVFRGYNRNKWVWLYFIEKKHKFYRFYGILDNDPDNVVRVSLGKNFSIDEETCTVMMDSILLPNIEEAWEQKTYYWFDNTYYNIKSYLTLMVFIAIFSGFLYLCT